MIITSQVVLYAAEECQRQRSGELSVAWMVDAWQYVRCFSKYYLPSPEDVLTLGALVEPVKNVNGFRKIPVRVGNSFDVLPPGQVESALITLLEYWSVAEPGAWYKEYETIHPFVDGNGRTGSLLYNWMRGTLDNPVAPPDYWS
jgi:Fic/DOC family